MAVTSVTLHASGTTGGRTNDGKAEYTAFYLVETDTVRDQTAVICDHFKNAGSLPYLNAVYSYGNDYDQNAICVGIDPRRQPNSQTSWVVSLKYATPTGDKDKEDEPKQEPDRDTGELTDDPTRWREQWDASFTQITVPCYAAVYRSGMQGASAVAMPVGKFGPPVNSCFEPFVPPEEKEVDIQVYRRSFYAFGYTGDTAAKYMGKVNSDHIAVARPELHLIFGANPACLRIKSIGGTLEYINKNAWWRISLEFWINPLSWRVFKIDEGLNRRAVPGYATGRGVAFAEGDFVDGRARLVPILDADGKPIQRPVLLNGAGEPLITTGVFPDPVYLEYSIYDEISLPPEIFRGYTLS